MGAYLSEPITEKETEEGVLHESLHFGASAMQGWRRGMEDEHIAAPLAAPQGSPRAKVAIFGVWDGHGGQEVAKFVKVHMAPELVKTDEYQRGDYGAALTRVFHRMDEMLWDKANLKELDGYKKGADDKPVTAGNARAADGALMLRPGGGRAAGARAAAAEEEEDDDDDGEGGGGKMSKADVMELFKMLMSAKSAKQAAQKEAASAGGGGAGGGAGGGPLAGLAGRVAAKASAPSVCELPPVHVTAGCTSVVAVVAGETLVVANAGDSRGVLCRRGKAVALSEDHKPTQAGELARIEAVGGFVNDAGRVNGNLNLSRSIGDLKYKQAKHAPPSAQMITAEPDIRTFTITPGPDEFMILACDGIWDTFSNDDAVEFVRSRLAEGTSPVEIAKEACDACMAADPKKTQGIGGDNMTCLIVVFKEVRGGSSM